MSKSESLFLFPFVGKEVIEVKDKKKRSWKPRPCPGPGYVEKFTAYVTTRNGRKIHAWMFGLKAFRIWVKVPS